MSAKKKGVNGGCLATGEGSTEKIFRSSFTRCQAIIIHIPLMYRCIRRHFIFRSGKKKVLGQEELEVAPSFFHVVVAD